MLWDIYFVCKLWHDSLKTGVTKTKLLIVKIDIGGKIAKYCHINICLISVEGTVVKSAIEISADIDINSDLGLAVQTEDALEIAVVKLELNDAMTMDRIKIPVKGSDCKHVQCFDKGNYEEMATSGQANCKNCPICNKAVLALLESRVFKELLSKVPSSVDAIEYDTKTKKFTVF